MRLMPTKTYTIVFVGNAAGQSGADGLLLATLVQN
jgi:hypothetical protein